jgi:hypothetical protein
MIGNQTCLAHPPNLQSRSKTPFENAALTQNKAPRKRYCGLHVVLLIHSQTGPKEAEAADYFQLLDEDVGIAGSA